MSLSPAVRSGPARALGALLVAPFPVALAALFFPAAVPFPAGDSGAWLFLGLLHGGLLLLPVGVVLLLRGQLALRDLPICLSASLGLWVLLICLLPAYVSG